MHRFSENTQGAILMMVAMAAFTLNDACMKTMGDRIPLPQLIVLRGLLTSGLMYLLFVYQGGLPSPVTGAGWRRLAWRGMAEAGAAFLFLTGLFHLPIANATSIMQVLPLTVALSAAVFLGAPLGWRRMVAISLGFIGVMLIIRPDASGFPIYSLYILAAVAVVTFRDILTRTFPASLPSIFVSLTSSMMVTAAGGVASLEVAWVPMGAGEVGILLLASALLAAAIHFSVMTMRVGDIAFVSPFRYSAIIWALFVGYVAFGEWPDAVTMLGVVIVVLSGIYSLYRENKRLSASARSSP